MNTINSRARASVAEWEALLTIEKVACQIIFCETVEGPFIMAFGISCVGHPGVQEILRIRFLWTRIVTSQRAISDSIYPKLHQKEQ